MENPTRQKHGMYDDLNRKGADHGTPKKDMGARNSDLDRHPIGYSRMVDGVNFRSPVQVTQIMGSDAKKSNWSAGKSHTFGQSDADFPSSQIPNTSPREVQNSAGLGISNRKVPQSSQSKIFHSTGRIKGQRII